MYCKNNQKKKQYAIFSCFHRLSASSVEELVLLSTQHCLVHLQCNLSTAGTVSQLVVLVECLLCNWEDVDSIPSQVISKTLNMALAAL